MVDLIVLKISYNEYKVYEIVNGKRQEKFIVGAIDFGDVIYRINEEYEYARILCGRNID